MTLTELRVGNLVGYQDEDYNNNPNEIDFINPVLEITDRFVIINSTARVQLILGELIPIPLTEEWLLKFGLRRDQEVWTLIETAWGIFIERDENDWSITVNKEYQIASIKFVHQLQNLYFALTGNELELK